MVAARGEIAKRYESQIFSVDTIAYSYRCCCGQRETKKNKNRQSHNHKGRGDCGISEGELQRKHFRFSPSSGGWIMPWSVTVTVPALFMVRIYEAVVELSWVRWISSILGKLCGIALDCSNWFCNCSVCSLSSCEWAWSVSITVS